MRLQIRRWKVRQFQQRRLLFLLAKLAITAAATALLSKVAILGLDLTNGAVTLPAVFGPEVFLRKRFAARRKSVQVNIDVRTVAFHRNQLEVAAKVTCVQSRQR